MNQIEYKKPYSDFKSELDTEIKQVANGFVKIGFLLKVARDTDVLYESGYKTVAEFAHAEYGLTKDVVSRWIAINDKFSENGYSDKLQDKYTEYGVAKLGEMLTMPDEVIEQMDPSLTRSDLQEVKKEIQEEQKTTDLEVLMEPKEKSVAEKSMAFQSMYLFWSRRPRAYRKMYKLAINADTVSDNIVDLIAPSGVLIAFERISGIGKIIISIKGDDDKATFTNTRHGETEECSINGILDMFREAFRPCLAIKPEEAWKNTYKENFPDLIEERANKPEKKTESKISKPEEAKKQEPNKQEPDRTSNIDAEHTAKVNNPNDNASEPKVAPVQQENKFELVPGKNEDMDKHEENTEQVLNTECESTSTTNISTSDNKRIVFEEIKTAADKMKECLDRFDITGAGRYLKDVNEIFNSLAADKDEDIPGQMSIDDSVGGSEDGRED